MALGSLSVATSPRFYRVDKSGQGSPLMFPMAENAPSYVRGRLSSPRNSWAHSVVVEMGFK